MGSSAAFVTGARPGHVALQRVPGGRAAPERRHRPVLIRRSRPALDQGQRRARPRAQQQPDEPDPRPRRGQGVGRGQQHCRQSEPGPCPRDVDGVQRRRRQREDPHRGLTRPRADVLEGDHDHPARHDHAGDDVRLPVGRQRRDALRGLRRRVRHEEQEPRRPRLRHEVDRRRKDVRTLRRSGHAEREPRRLPAQHEVSATASSSTSPPARRIRGTRTWSTRTGTPRAASSMSSSRRPRTAVRPGRRRKP
jgi:hypothetical protein